MIVWIVAGIAIAALAFWAVITYNRFQELSNAGEAQLQQIRVAMKKRLDMLTKLVDSVKSYATFEKDVMEKVTSLRSGIDNAGAKEIGMAEAVAKDLVGRISVAVENYPELKTSETVKELMSSIKDVEEELARQRYTYNNIAQEFNTRLSTIPSSIIGAAAGMKKMDYLNIEAENPDVKWNA